VLQVPLTAHGDILRAEHTEAAHKHCLQLLQPLCLMQPLPLPPLLLPPLLPSLLPLLCAPYTATVVLLPIDLKMGSLSHKTSSVTPGRHSRLALLACESVPRPPATQENTETDVNSCTPSILFAPDSTLTACLWCWQGIQGTVMCRLCNLAHMHASVSRRLTMPPQLRHFSAASIG
jgi:hypothetical protein